MQRTSVPVLVLFALVAVAAALVACDGASGTLGGGGAQVRVLITDAPADSIESAMVTISRVYLQPADDGGSPVDLLPASADPVTYDLLELRNGVEALLADGGVPAGTYEQLRLIVEDATVTLVPGATFSDGTTTRTLTVPSGMQTGIKVRLDEPIVAEDGTLTIVVVDFDVNQNFVLQGDPGTPAGIHGVLFTPTVHEHRRTEMSMP